MAAFSKSELELLLDKRGLGGTLYRQSPDPVSAESRPLALVPGTIMELIPDGGCGLTSTALHLAARCPGKAAWLDPGDRLDPSAVIGAGLNPSRLLWVRGGSTEIALRAAQLLVQAGGFGLVVLDLLDQPEREWAVPRAAWFRLLRGIERERRTALLVLAPRSLAGTCSDRVIAVRYAGVRWNERAKPLLEGADIEVSLQATRREGAKRPPAAEIPLRARVVA